LSDGSTLLLGVSQWLTPQGRLIRQKGIEPDIAVSLPADARILFPGVIKDMTKAEIMKSQDTQMLRALEELNAIPSMGPQNSHWQELQLVK
jgi:carboxyl-terminal processing protease